MNFFSSGGNLSFRGAEYQRFIMSLFISKFELRMITIKEHQLHDKDNTLL
jgi:hypothetical protein